MLKCTNVVEGPVSKFCINFFIQLPRWVHLHSHHSAAYELNYNWVAPAAPLWDGETNNWLHIQTERQKQTKKNNKCLLLNNLAECITKGDLYVKLNYGNSIFATVQLSTADNRLKEQHPGAKIVLWNLPVQCLVQWWLKSSSVFDTKLLLSSPSSLS